MNAPLFMHRRRAGLAAELALNIALCCLICPSETAAATPATQAGTLLFRSGFEPESRIAHGSDLRTSDDQIVGRDSSVPPPNDWVEDFAHSPWLGRFSIQYQGGDTSMRHARIIPEPGRPDNHVLHFWLQHPNVGGGTKGRVQANIYPEVGRPVKGIKQLYQKVRLKLHPDMEVLREYPQRVNWLTILEVWNNIQWVNDPFPFRLTVGIGKPSPAAESLYFMVDAQDYEYRTTTNPARYVTIWHAMNTNASVPVGFWMTLEYFIGEGGADTGRFYLAMTPESGERVVIFDQRGFMHNTKDPTPDGITLWNPMKLYTSKQLVNFAAAQGKALQVYWDDLEIWMDRPPDSIK